MTKNEMNENVITKGNSCLKVKSYIILFLTLQKLFANVHFL